MAIWSAEINELERIKESLKGHLPNLEKELAHFIKTDDPNVILLYSRRCLEVIIIDLCECELKRARGTEPLKGIIDKLHKEEKVPSYIITSMHGLNDLSAYGAHPKDFDPEQVKPVLNNLSVIFKWYFKYKGIEIINKQNIAEPKEITIDTGKLTPDIANLEKSVAILPFKNDSKDEENTYFINGLMEEVLNNLQKIKDLRIISRTSVEQYRNQTKSLPEIAKELGVNYIVEGSGQKYGGLFRLRVQLIMAAKETYLWGESYQQNINDIGDIFRIQGQIAECIANELKAVITPNEKDLIQKIPLTNLETYDAYLKGRFYFRKFTLDDLKSAKQYFELAREKDPEFALSYAGICDVWNALQQMGYVLPAEAGPKAMAAVMKALELDSNLAEVYGTLGFMKLAGMWDWKGSELSFKKAIALNPNIAEARGFYSFLLSILGRYKEAKEQIRLALSLDPFNPLLHSFYSFDLLFIHLYDDAIEIARNALKMDSASPVSIWSLAAALNLTGRHAEALEQLKKYYGIIYMDMIEAFDQEEAKTDYEIILKSAAKELAEKSGNTYIAPTDIAILYAFIGNKECTINWLEQAYQVRDPGLVSLLLPIYDNLRDEPRFQDIAKKMNLPYKPID
jgi:adenylate cyclase